MGEYALGQSVPRSEDPRLLTGGGWYVDDLRLPHMAHGCVLRSPYAHAKINHIETRAAAQMPGVLAVLTGADWAASGLGDMPLGSGRKRRDGSPMFTHPFPALVRDRVRRVGDYVAFVVAETAAAARDASEAIEVDYEPLPAVVSAEEAMKPGAPAVWDDCPDNVCFVHEAGDRAATDAAFAAASHVVRRRLVINRVTAATMEPRGCVGHYDPREDRYTIYTTGQNVHPYRSSVANRVLKVPETKLRVVSGDIGGSFGMKANLYNEVPLTLWASRVIGGYPVRWTCERSEAFLADNMGRDNVTEAELALDNDGKFLALRVRTIGNLGCYITATTSNPLVMNIGGLAGVYVIPAIHVDVTGVMTNVHPTCPYRGAGRPESSYVIERIIDLAADTLGIDPADLRRRNAIPPEALPYKTALTFTLDSGEFARNLDLALEMADYAGFERRRAAARKRGRLRGIGISNTVERAASPGLEGAEVRFDRSGTAQLIVGSVTSGQGHETVFKQIVCDALGLRPEQVHYIWGDTDKLAFGQGTGGSRSSALGGSAVHLAAQKILDKAKRIAAHVLEAAVEDVEFADGTFRVAGTDRSITMAQVARAAVDPTRLPPDTEPGLLATAVFASKAANFPNGCHICELEIDPETGAVEVVGYNVVDDVGTVMNPMLLKGQIHGGIAQGLGQVLMEDIAYDSDGQLVTGSFMDYAMPRADDICFIEVKSNPVPTKSNPLGVKGAGEAGTVGALPAVTNAVIDALSPLGIRHIDMPLTPEKLWRAICAAGGTA
jgi:carbon-monoxide dehydrogenase large subunit